MTPIWPSCLKDATYGRIPAGHGLPIINARCADVSKSRVAAVFEQVSGRALSLDPETWPGPMVVKSETNGAHDGRVVDGPRPATPGLVHQRLIDTRAPDGMVEDLRCPTVDGEIAAVFLKRRPVASRFANANAEVRRLDPAEAFDEEERALVREFCRALGLEWGGVDVLRERSSDALWIVDANKTDMGPPTALPLADKLAGARTIGARLRAYCERRLETARGAPTP
jgi:Glutathione synthase/Ribosomal protein S6 modification enzyme (glutaminyl transferase)